MFSHFERILERMLERRAQCLIVGGFVGRAPAPPRACTDDWNDRMLKKAYRRDACHARRSPPAAGDAGRGTSGGCAGVRGPSQRRRAMTGAGRGGRGRSTVAAGASSSTGRRARRGRRIPGRTRPCSPPGTAVAGSVLGPARGPDARVRLQTAMSSLILRGESHTDPV
jgi:hypothetical protein